MNGCPCNARSHWVCQSCSPFCHNDWKVKRGDPLYDIHMPEHHICIRVFLSSRGKTLFQSTDRIWLDSIENFITVEVLTISQRKPTHFTLIQKILLYWVLLYPVLLSLSVLAYMCVEIEVLNCIKWAFQSHIHNTPRKPRPPIQSHFGKKR